MICGKLLWLAVVQFAIFKGFHCFNTTEKIVKDIVTLNKTTQVVSPTVHKTANTSTPITTTPRQNTVPEELTSVNSTIANETKLEILEIFHGNSTPAKALPSEQINVNCLNATCTHHSRNDTFRTNYTMTGEVKQSVEDFPAFRLPNTAAIAAGVFLVSAVIGYISCVGYRRIKQRKYGNSQILIGEEVYDTADLRYFEI